MKTTFVLLLASMVIPTAAMAGKLEIAPITAVQVDAIKVAFPTKLKNKQIATAILQASETITEFLKVESCITGDNATPLNTFAAPGKEYLSFSYIGPMLMMRSHSKSACLTVNKIHGFEMPTKNMLSFEVVFAAEDSGEMSKRHYAVQQQDDGSWLFR
jgi:hypothetical protein